MSDGLRNLELNEEGVEKLNFKKVRWIISNYWLWLAIFILITNLTAYLFLRYTKPVFEATSEIKMDIESDATEFGLGVLAEDKSVSVLSGEIELLRSRLFFQKLLDSLDLTVSYFTKGRILSDEKYPANYFRVEYSLKDQLWLDLPISVKFSDNETFTFGLQDDPDSPSVRVGEWTENEHIRFRLVVNQPSFDLSSENFIFRINSNETLQRYLEQNLNVSFLNLKANTLQISFRDHNARKAQDIVNAINSIYIRYTTEEKSRANKNKIEWINSQLTKISDELESFESYFEDFTIANRTSDLDEDLRNTLESINKLDSQQFEIDRRIRATRLLEAELDSSKVVSPPLLLPSEIKNEVVRLNDLLIERRQIGLSFRETTFTIQEKDQEIEAMRTALSELLTNYQNGLQHSAEELSNRRTRLERSFSSIPGKSTEFNKNTRFYNLYEEFYLSLMQSKAEFEIAVAGITPNFKVLSAAKTGDVPVYPNNTIIQGSGLATGLILCFVFVGFKYVMEDKVNSVEETESLLPYPMIGIVPRSRAKSDGSTLIGIDQPRSGVSESLRSVRTNIQFLVPEEKSQVIVVTSSISGEGKTFIASNLAAIMAMSEKRVCVVDLDLRKPSIHTRFHSENGEKGVSTILIGKYKALDCVEQGGTPNLSYIKAGPVPPNPSELLMGNAFENFIGELKGEFDLVILDSPPVGLVTDGILAMRVADLSIMVARYGYTRKRDIKAARRTLALNQAKLAVIFNSTENQSDYGYHYGYYSDKKGN